MCFLADENIHQDITIHLRNQGLNIISIKEIGLIGSDDITILRKSYSENRIIITHDSDFGTLGILSGEPIVGIVYLRPGHIKPIFTINTFNALLEQKIDINAPFLLVAEILESSIKIRIRKLA